MGIRKSVLEKLLENTEDALKNFEEKGIKSAISYTKGQKDILEILIKCCD